MSVRGVCVGMVAVVLLCASAARAAEDEASGRTYKAGDKLVRGVVNVCTGFIEIPRNIHNRTETQSMLAGWTVGLVKGLGYTFIRMVAGAYEVLTFPFPAPPEYVPVVQPEFVWEAPGPRYK